MAQLQQSTTSESSAPAYTQDHFFDEVTSFLQETKDQSLLLSYNYKPGDELSGKVEDFAVLHALYDWIFSPEVHFDDPKEQDKVMNLGKAMISFMKRGAIAKSSRINNGTSTYPILSLMYDMYNGIVARGGVSSYSEFANFFNAEFAHVSNLPQTSKESKALRDNHFGRAKRLIEDGSIPVPRIRTRPRKEGLEVYDDVVDYLLSKEYRLFNGFIALTPDIYRSAGLLENRRVLTQIRNQMKGHRVRFNEEEYQKYMTFMQKDAYDIIITHNLYRDQGIDINIGHNIDRELSLSEPEDSLVREYKTDLKHKLDDVARTGKKIQGDRGKTQYQMQEELQRYYLQKFFLGDFLGADKELIERIEKENKFLWDGVLDRQMWFVSPRGDKFEAKRDGGLQQRGISYLKYNFDKEYPREHNVEVQLEGVDNPLHFWLTADRRLLDSERRLISVDSLVQQGFMNTLLTRLFFITSGMLGEEQSEFPVKGIDSLDLIYRRAHYRTLTSTELRTITMQSPGAIRHAQEIWDEYRINLDQEEKRRWDLGTLPRDKRLTFVRSTEPEIKSRDIIPNTILFDPSKITIPIYEWERVSQERRT